MNPLAERLVAARRRKIFITFLDRFWAHIPKGKKNECWEWTGMRAKDTSYGRFWLNGEDFGAHVVAFELSHGKPPKGTHILHHCDNPPCCNPDHLFAGTHQINMADKMAKGRHRFRFGSAHADATITEAEALEIKNELSRGSKAMDIARARGVSPYIVYNIKWGRSWHHFILHRKFYRKAV